MFSSTAKTAFAGTRSNRTGDVALAQASVGPLAASKQSYAEVVSVDGTALAPSIGPAESRKMAFATTVAKAESNDDTEESDNLLESIGRSAFGNQRIAMAIIGKEISKFDLGSALLRPVSINDSYRSQGAHNKYGVAVDLAAPLGSNIYAAADGVVMIAQIGGWNWGYGDYVVISSTIDGHDVYTVYAHMSKVIAKVGQTVKRGQLIGLVGHSGRSTGDHLHFEVHGAKNPIVANANYTGE